MPARSSLGHSQILVRGSAISFTNGERVGQGDRHLFFVLFFFLCVCVLFFSVQIGTKTWVEFVDLFVGFVVV